MSSPPAIAIRDLKFAYAGRQNTPKPFSLTLPEWSVEQGARVALHGHSGCGKSTLLNLIAGALTPSSGTVHICGENITTMSAAQRRATRIQKMGFVFQDFPLVGHLSATENVLLPYRLNPTLRLEDSARNRAAALLTQLGLKEKQKSRPTQLSQGEQQRVAIARALVTEPTILLADEPTAGLDPPRTQQVMDALEQLSSSQGLTLVLVTHDPRLLARFSQVLEVGR